MVKKGFVRVAAFVWLEVLCVGTTSSGGTQPFSSERSRPAFSFAPCPRAGAASRRFDQSCSLQLNGLSGALPRPSSKGFGFKVDPVLRLKARNESPGPWAEFRRSSASSLRSLQMMKESAPGWEGYDKRKGTVLLADAISGSWKIEWTEEGSHYSSLISLHPDGSCTPPSDASEGMSFLRGVWRVEGNEVTILYKRTLGASMLVFQGLIAESEDAHYGSMVAGNVLDGETEPLWMGKFSLKQVVGKASMGLAPGKPAPTESRASHGFALGGRSDQKVLKRFEGTWATSATMESERVLMYIELFRNGTFETSSYRRFKKDGIKTGGVLRGRWNVYYSEQTETDRFWMQVKRLKCSGVNLWSDLLFLGDIEAIDTGDEILAVLARQAAAVENVTLEDVDASLDSNSSVSANATATAHPEVAPEELTPADRGVFTRGERRRMELSGTILSGVQLEPVTMGAFHMMQEEDGDSGVWVDPGKKTADHWSSEMGQGDEL